MSARTVISIVVEGAVAEALVTAWPAGDGVPESLRRRLEEALYQSAPSIVSRAHLRKHVKYSVAHLGDGRPQALGPRHGPPAPAPRPALEVEGEALRRARVRRALE